MQLKPLHKNLSSGEQKFFNEYLEQKLDSITGLLKHFSEDSLVMDASAAKFDKHNAFEVELRLTLPSKTLVSTETSHELNKSIDLAKDRLIAQIKKHLAQLRNSREHQSIREPETIEVTSPATAAEFK